MITQSIAESHKDRTDYWKDSPFELLHALENDERGKWGEAFLHKLLTKAGVPNTWDGDCNTDAEDGTYDIKLTASPLSRVEVKTSLNESNWQHEPIYAAPRWDRLVLIDINYDHIFISVFTHSQLACILVPGSAKHPHLGKGATLRKDKEDGYKFDFSPATINNGLTHGYTFSYDMNEPDDSGLLEFVRSKCI